jgi:hypothetical protein
LRFYFGLQPHPVEQLLAPVLAQIPFDCWRREHTNHAKAPNSNIPPHIHASALIAANPPAPKTSNGIEQHARHARAATPNHFLLFVIFIPRRYLKKSIYRQLQSIGSTNSNA